MRYLQGLGLIIVLLWQFTGMANSAQTIGIIVFDNVLTSDITAPAEVFGIASRKAWFSNYDVKLIGIERKSSVTTEEGLTLTVDATIFDNPVLDVILVPSAYDMAPLVNNRPLVNYIQHQSQHVQWLASNCSGAFILGAAGLLDGYRATTWAGGEKELQQTYPKINVVENQNLVVDRNRLTSNGSLVSYQAALVLLAKMSSEERAKEVFETLQMERLMNWGTVKSYL